MGSYLCRSVCERDAARAASNYLSRFKIVNVFKNFELISNKGTRGECSNALAAASSLGFRPRLFSARAILLAFGEQFKRIIPLFYLLENPALGNNLLATLTDISPASLSL